MIDFSFQFMAFQKIFSCIMYTVHGVYVLNPLYNPTNLNALLKFGIILNPDSFYLYLKLKYVTFMC